MSVASAAADGSPQRVRIIRTDPCCHQLSPGDWREGRTVRPIGLSVGTQSHHWTAYG